MPEKLELSKKIVDDQAIFEVARKINSRDARLAYLRQACGTDSALERRIEALLHAYDNSQTFLESPPSPPSPLFAATPFVPPLSEPVGAMIGPYKLREVLGEGGMGTVYVAEQEKPLRRKVALKVIKPGMDTREVIGRFEAERQALALMDHPNIAKVYDAGTTDSGRPYFVMELVRGMPITEYCDRRKLPPRERIKLFITVCQAIQHAHQRGIIHRDLKPSNVLITLHDGTPVPKVIDFGVAKAVNQKLTEQTLYTRHAQMVGTPLYMSPEQAELSGLEIDTRSDVYSLGVLLYELLTGHTPFNKETFSKVGFDEMRRIIREDEPPRPSHRVSTLAAEARSTVSSQRATDERQLARDLRGELDWIVMNALEKDRTRRYGSADALAADLQRYLDDQPVKACPPSLGYRVRKLIRRKTRAMGATTLLMISVALVVCGPLAAYGVFMLIRGADLAPRESVSREQASTTAGAAVPSAVPSARAPGRELPGLVPEPLLIPEVGRWQLITKKPRGLLRSAVWSPDETRIALGEANNVRIYDAVTMQLLHVLVGHSRDVRSVTWHPDGKRLASAGEDGTVRLWTSDGVPTHLLQGHSGMVYQVAWRPDGELLASAAADGTVRLWNSDGTAGRVLEESGRHVFGIDWSPDGELLAGAGGNLTPPSDEGDPGDNAVRVWNPETGELVHKFDGAVKHSSLCVDWRPDGKQLAVGYGDMFRATHGTADFRPVPQAGIRIWNSDGTSGPEIAGEFGSINAVAWHPDGKRLAFGGRVAIARIWNADDRSVTEYKASEWGRDLYSLCWKRDGSRLLSTICASVREWDNDGTETAILKNHFLDRAFYTVKWSPDGKTIAAGADSTRIAPLFWSADGTPAPQPDPPADNLPGWWERATQNRRPDGTPGQKLESPVPAMREWAWSKDGWLAGATWDIPGVRIWDDQGKRIAAPNGHRRGVESVAWSPDGAWLASAGDHTVRLWKRDGSPGPVLTGHTNEVSLVNWSPDGRWLASAGIDGTIRLWKPDGAPGQVIQTGHAGGIMDGQDIAWSPDSRRIVSAGYYDGTVRLWNVETEKTEWMAVRTDAGAAVTLSPSGQPLHGKRELLESSLFYLVEKPNGAMDLLTFADFWKRHVKSFVTAYAEQCKRAIAKKDWDTAEAAFADAMTFLPDASPNVRSLIADVGENLFATLTRDEYTRAVRIARTSIDIREKIVAGLPDDADQQSRLGAAYNSLGLLLLDTRQLPEALAALNHSIDNHQKNFERFPDREIYRNDLRSPHLNRAHVHYHLNQFDDAQTDFAKSIELNPDVYSAHINRAEIYAVQQQYEKAAAAFTEVITLQPRLLKVKEARPWGRKALLQLYLGDLEGYRATCRTMLGEFADTNDVADAQFVAGVSALHPHAVEDYETPLRLANRAVELSPDVKGRLRVQGAVLYRAGCHQEAVDRLTKVDRRYADGDKDWELAYIWYFLAMAQHDLGNVQEAATWLRKADDFTRDELFDPKLWNIKLGLEFLRREAHALIDPAGSSELPAGVPLPKE